MNQFIHPDMFFLIAGPCVLESQDHALFMADAINTITDRLGIKFCFKASWDKANRTSAQNYRGPGLEEGLRILEKCRSAVGVPVCTDFHEPWQAAQIAEVADIIQIPAFLCRQTDMIAAAARTGKVVNVKKAQFLSPEEMGKVVKKFEDFGNRDIMLCERGTCFGYHDLVADMTSLPRMRRFGYPVVFDATHSVQVSGGGPGFGNSGRREFVPVLARAALATGAVDGLFMETHNEPDNAACDGSCMLPLDRLESLLRQLRDIRRLQNRYSWQNIEE